MKRRTKKLLALLLTFLLTLSCTVTSAAAESSIIFHGREDGFTVRSGSGYTATDLFDSFKDVMPGDHLTEQIEIRNNADDCDYIKVYMKAVAHDEETNPLTYSETYEEQDGKDQAHVAGQRDETVATMKDFLSRLDMRIFNGGTQIFEGSPDEEDGLAERVYFGSLSQGESLELKVELDVPITLGNEYANRVGEVDWVFITEGFDEEKITVHKVWLDCYNIQHQRPKSVSVQLFKDGKVYDEKVLSYKNYWTHTWDDLEEGHTWTVKEKEVPERYKVFYGKTDNIYWVVNYKCCGIPDCPDWPDCPDKPTTEEPTTEEPTTEEPTTEEPTTEEPTTEEPTTEEPTTEEPTTEEPTTEEPTTEEPTTEEPTTEEPTTEEPTTEEPTTEEPTTEEPTTEEPEDDPVIPPQKTELTVKKEWSGDEKRLDKRPASVSVTLYNGTEAVDKVVLSEENDWTHTWKDLDGSGTWGVLETGIPKGYTPSYRADGTVVTITNTASLIQTGQANWPVLVLGGLGACMLLCGAVVMGRKRKDEQA